MREKKTRRPKRGMSCKILSLVLCVCLVVPMLALTGCEQNYEQLPKEKVQFDKTGEYTVKFQKGDLLDILEDGNVQDTSAKPACEFKDIAKEDVVVSYSSAKNEVVTDEQGNSVDELKIENKHADIINFENNGKEITITFKDEGNLADNVYDDYSIIIEKAKSVVIVEPQIPDNTLSSTTTEISSDDTENTFIIECKEGKFNPEISAEQIYLDNSFRDMKIESLEAKDNRLTIKLSGKPVIIPEISNVYTAGIIDILPDGFEKAVYSEEIAIDVKPPVVAVDTENIKGANGKWTVPINVDGKDVSNITAEDISFGENTKVTDISKKNGQVIAEVEADNIDELGGPIQFGDEEYLSSFAHASVLPYPVSYEKEGDNFVIQFYLLPQIGSINDKIDKSQINLLDDFAGGNVRSIEQDDEGDFFVTIEVPSNGASVDDMHLVGTLEFAEGALVEEWGDDAPVYYISALYNKDDFTITNSTDEELVDGYKFDLTSLFGGVVYAAENNGNNNNNNNDWVNVEKPKSNEAEDALKAQRKKDNNWKATNMAVDYVTGKLTNVGGTAAEVAKYGKIIFDFGKGIATGNPADIVSGVIGTIEAMGIFDGEVDPNNPNNKNLDEKIKDMNILLNAMDQKLDAVIKNQYKQMTQGYENALDALRTDCQRAENMLQNAKEIYVAQGNKVPDKNEKNLDVLKKYNADLIRIIKDEEQKGTGGFRGYTSLINRIENNYILVTTETSKTWDKNPIFYNDSAWSQYFNFDTEAYYLDEAYRSNVKYQIARTYAVLCFYYEIPANGNTYNDLTMRMKDSLETIDAHPAGPKPETDFTVKKLGEYTFFYYPKNNQKVYSSTLRRTVVGFNHPENGVSSEKGKNDPRIRVSAWTGDTKETITSPYKIDYPTIQKYISKVHTKDKDPWPDLILAFPYLEKADRLYRRGFGIGFGGDWTKSKFRIEAQGLFALHDWIWYEQMLSWYGKFESVKTYDTGEKKNYANFLRFEFQ